MPKFRTRLPQISLIASTIVLALVMMACGKDEPPPTLEPGSGALVELDFSSPDFSDMAGIPAKFTCDGANQSPRLEWGPIPEGTTALTIIVDDPDAASGIFNHWVVFNLPVDLRGLAAGQAATETLAVGGSQGKNDAGSLGWTGPCPPPGQTHEYDFFLYALMAPIELDPGVKRNDVAKAMRDAGVLGVGTFSGMYTRP